MVKYNNKMLTDKEFCKLKNYPYEIFHTFRLYHLGMLSSELIAEFELQYLQDDKLKEKYKPKIKNIMPSTDKQVKSPKTKNNFEPNTTRFRRIWYSMLQRCNNTKCANYKYYGAKNVKVCAEWQNFETFKKDMYESYCNHIKEYGEKDTTIDRIDPFGNYCLKNCRWATRYQQSYNKRSALRFPSGEPVQDYCVTYNLDFSKVLEKINSGYAIDEALIEVELEKENDAL